MSIHSSASAKQVAIIGAGVAALHLGLYLLQHNIPVTIYNERSAADFRSGRLHSTVALMGTTRERTRALGIHDWDAPSFDTGQMHIYVGGEQPLSFTGHPAAPLLFIDMRLYLPRLLDAFVERGGQLILQDTQVNDVATLAASAAVVVVATGRNGLTQLFPRVPAESPYTQPQRLLMGGLFHGIRPLNPQGMCFQIAPGQGEIFESRFLSLTGKLGGLLIEAIPGSELAAMASLRYDEEPARFMATLLALLKRHAPLTYERIDPDAFTLNRPLDLLQGAITPTVRRAYTGMGDNRFVLALGDTHITHDPLTGQGANAAARAAWVLGETIVEAFGAGATLDEAFYQHAEQRLWANLQPVTAWSNAMLQPPPPHMIELLVAATHQPAVANAFASSFNDPDRAWETFSTPPRTAAFLQSFGWTPAAMTASV